MNTMVKIGAAIAAGALSLAALSTAPAQAATPGTAAAHRSDALGPFGYGGVKLGMSAKQAKATGKIVRKAGASDCSGWDLNKHPTGRYSVGIYISKKLGVAVIGAPKGVKTPQGIGIGSTRTELRKAYPKLETSASGSKDNLFTNIPGNRKAFYRFLLEHNKIYSLSLELKNQDCTN
jgi:hypothetical protein